MIVDPSGPPGLRRLCFASPFSSSRPPAAICASSLFFTFRHFLPAFSSQRISISLKRKQNFEADASETRGSLARSPHAPDGGAPSPGRPRLSLCGPRSSPRVQHPGPCDPAARLVLSSLLLLSVLVAALASPRPGHVGGLPAVRHTPSAFLLGFLLEHLAPGPYLPEPSVNEASLTRIARRSLVKLLPGAVTAFQALRG